MILIFGGTTEGKKAANVVDKAGKSFFYSTKTSTIVDGIDNAILLTRAMDKVAIYNFCLENNVRLIIDAAHPFAIELHGNIGFVSEQLRIPVIRYERIYPSRNPDFIWCDSFDEAVNYLKANGIKSLIAFSGVQTIPKLKDYWQENKCWFRILNTEKSLKMALSHAFPKDNLLIFDAKVANEYQLIRELNPKAIITKESGESGFFQRKVDAAVKCGVKVIVVKHPVLSDKFLPVYNDAELEDKIRELNDDFFPLRTGFTTGSCATAAAKAATTALLTGNKQKEVEIFLPDGRSIFFNIEECHIGNNFVSCTVKKDAGDDPDVTNGLLIGAKVCLNSASEIRFKQGDGVGVVTLPGFEISVGEPAINPVPRKMISNAVSQVLDFYSEERGVDVSIFVPGGEEIAKKTLNSKLGIKGGISIIGTSGIVRPFSKSAFVASIKKEIDIAVANGCEHIVINSGAKSENYLKTRFNHLSERAFIHYGNFIGETIIKARECNVKKLSLGIMIGKAVKLAEGHLDTHSKRVLMNRDYLVKIATECLYNEDYIGKIKTLNLARELSGIFKFDSSEAFFNKLMKACYDVCKPLAGDVEMEFLLINNEGDILAFKFD